MAQITHFFAGANSGSGFQNLFTEIANPELARDFMILKGGPGVGKNTFMRAIGQAMESEGLRVEYLWCSGDPDSLDGVVIPELNCAIADGTSPHVLEPRYPAAVDRYVNLGEFYDITAAKADAGAVRTHTKAYQAAYRRAYRALNAARQTESAAIASVEFDMERAQRRFRGIALRELRRRGTQQGNTVRRFLGSLTHKGYVWRFDSVETLCSRVYVIADRFGFASPLLAQLHAAAVSHGWDCITCMSPENPEQIEHLLIPGLELGFVSVRPGMEYSGAPFRRIRLDALTEIPSKTAVRTELRIVDLLREEAVTALKEAKACHDRLEGVYNPYVDFEGVRAAAVLEAGRILSFR